ncbi:MAG: hypothetical protein ACK5N8_04220 [Alphaproteobacteria bacterium]
MKKQHLLYMMISVIIFQFTSVTEANSAVYFIEKGDSAHGNSNKPCLLMGYKYTVKNCDKILMQPCSSDGNYYRVCGCDSSYKYDTTNCEMPKTVGPSLCAGKSNTCSCSKDYDTTTQQCEEKGLLPEGESCDNLYKGCTCAPEYSQTCTGGKIGIGEACDGKYKSCRCDDTYMICKNGGAAGASSCNDEEGAKYTSCKPDVKPGCPIGYVDTSSFWGGFWNAFYTNATTTCPIQ